MQFIDLEIGPVERVFGLASVQLHTAAAATDARIPGLPRAEAERLRDRLTQAGGSQSDRTLNERWSRVSPLSPLVKFSGAPIFAFLYLSGDHRGARGILDVIIPVAIIALAVLGGFISWLVTRWRINGTDLQIEMGLIRRQSLRIPLERIQAVDVVSPLLARFLACQKCAWCRRVAVKKRAAWLTCAMSRRSKFAVNSWRWPTACHRRRRRRPSIRSL